MCIFTHEKDSRRPQQTADQLDERGSVHIHARALTHGVYAHANTQRARTRTLRQKMKISEQAALVVGTFIKTLQVGRGGVGFKLL